MQKIEVHILQTKKIFISSLKINEIYNSFFYLQQSSTSNIKYCVSQPSWRYIRDMSKIYRRYVKNISEIFENFNRNKKNKIINI